MPELPVPVPQQVLNQSASLFVAWRQLGDGQVGVVTLVDGHGTTVASVAGEVGDPSCEVPAPASWPNPPYTVSVAAREGTSVGAASSAIPVLLASAPLQEVLYDGRAVALEVNPPGDDTGIEHIPTLYSDGAAQNMPAFRGLLGTIALVGALASVRYQVQITDARTIPVQSPYSCETQAPPGVLAELLSQPATITGAYWRANAPYDVDVSPPAGQGPPVTSYRVHYSAGSVRGAACDCPAGHVTIDCSNCPRTLGDVAPLRAFAAALATSGGARICGPDSAPYYLIDTAPSAARLALTTAGPLRASWSAIAVTLPPPLSIGYRATLYCDGTPMEHAPVTTPGQLSAVFKTALHPGVIPTVTVTAVSSANSVGPPSAPVRGPLRAACTNVGYDPLGRLRSLAWEGWGGWTYEYDNAGNVLRATVAPQGPP
jgi:hypothetical protein